MVGDENIIMSENSNKNIDGKCKKCLETCICESGKFCYNNEKCCYLTPKDVSIVQVNDPNLYQIIVDYNNLYLTAIPLEINTSAYAIDSSSIQRPNDTLLIKEEGLYCIYFSLKYNFKFNENMKIGDLFRVNFEIKGNDKEIFSINNTIVAPNILEESGEIINTIQGSKLQIVEDELPYRINIKLSEFQFDLSILNQIIITDLTLIVKK